MKKNSPANYSDEEFFELLKECSERKEIAWYELHRLMGPHIRKKLKQNLHLQEIDEVEQKVWIKICDTLPKLNLLKENKKENCKEVFLCCINRIISSIYCDYLRDKEKRSFYPIGIINAQTNIEEEVLRHERILMVRKAIEELPGKEKNVVKKWLIYEKQKKIAESLGISEGEVSKRLNNAKKELKKYLQEKGISI